MCNKFCVIYESFSYMTTPSAIKRWGCFLQGDNLVVFNYLCASEIWPDKSGTLLQYSLAENHRPATSQLHLAWAEFALTTLIVIGTDCIGSCKSNYHTITTTMAPYVIMSSNLISLMKNVINIVIRHARTWTFC